MLFFSHGCVASLYSMQYVHKLCKTRKTVCFTTEVAEIDNLFYNKFYWNIPSKNEYNVYMLRSSRLSVFYDSMHEISESHYEIYASLPQSEPEEWLYMFS